MAVPKLFLVAVVVDYGARHFIDVGGENPIPTKPLT